TSEAQRRLPSGTCRALSFARHAALRLLRSRRLGWTDDPVPRSRTAVRGEPRLVERRHVRERDGRRLARQPTAPRDPARSEPAQDRCRHSGRRLPWLVDRHPGHRRFRRQLGGPSETESVPSGRAARPHWLRPGIAVVPIALAIEAPCVLASERPSHPEDELRLARPLASPKDEHAVVGVDEAEARIVAELLDP